LVDAVPDNRNWQRDLAYARMQQGWLAWGMGNDELAYRRLVEAEIGLQALLAVNPQSADWRVLLAICRNYLSVVLLKRGEPGKASAVIAGAEQYLSTQGNTGTSASTQIMRAMIEITAGEVAATQDDRSASRHWLNAVDTLSLRAQSSNDPRVLDPYVRALLLLDRRKEVDPYLQRLNRAGYHSPMFEWYLKPDHYRTYSLSPYHTRNRTL
jgi:eukaryotic-like serine/threonine-protein kinase